MENTPPVIFTLAELLMSKMAECYSKYGIYAKWAVGGFGALYGAAFCAFELSDMYYDSIEKDDEAGFIYTVDDALPFPPFEDANVYRPELAAAIRAARYQEVDDHPPLNLPANYEWNLIPRPSALLTFRTPHGFVQLPPLGNFAAIYAYFKLHQRLSRKFGAWDSRVSMFHSNLLYLVHPYPMDYFKASSDDIPEEMYRRTEMSLIVLVRLLNVQIANMLDNID